MSISRCVQDHATLQKYLNLPQKGKIQCEYIWIGGTGSDIRSKTRTLKSKPKSIKDIPCWNYDGSSTDPFRGGDNILCLCQTLNAKTMRPL